VPVGKGGMTELRGAAKSRFVRGMFAGVSPRYDLMNRLMTFGLDQGWRRRVVAEAAVPAAGRVLDVATGTGDIALAFRQPGPRGRGPGPEDDERSVVGIDFCQPMLEVAREKAQQTSQATAGRVSPSFLAGDALALPFLDGAFAAVTSGFAMRNVADIQDAFSEMCRVTRPGGRVVCLEVARPANAAVRFLHGVYFGRVVPLLGRLVSGQGAAYAYLPASAGRFPPPAELQAIMERAGWSQVRYILLGLGAVAIHVGVKV